MTKALALFQEHPDVFTEPRALARFLAGVASPATSRAKLVSHPQFGVFADVRFGVMLEEICGP
jgi:ATP-dependent DNA helicase RecQ